jgi:undecaprenyl diphosphate synthase
MDTIDNKLDLNRIPSHVAIIMDGNGRWAKKQGSPRLFGHASGVNSVRDVTEAADDLGIKYLTLYAFSTENWNRPQEEVDGIMSLIAQTIESETPLLHEKNVRILRIGDFTRISDDINKRFEACMKKTENNTGLTLILAISYSSRWELTKATQDIANDLAQGLIKKEDITEELISNYLCTKNIPDPELLIRTSGEYRISNFLLWQIAYSELYFTNVLWPDFRRKDLIESILDYQSRERRFGKTSEQITK